MLFLSQYSQILETMEICVKEFVGADRVYEGETNGTSYRMPIGGFSAIVKLRKLCQAGFQELPPAEEGESWAGWAFRS